MSGATVLLELEAQLSEEERTERAKEAMRLTDQYDKMDDEFKDSRADWRRRLKELKMRRDNMKKAFLEGSEMQKVECVEHINFEKKTAEYLHAGKVVKSRELSMQEIANLESIPLFPDPITPSSEMREVISGETNRKTKKDLVGAH